MIYTFHNYNYNAIIKQLIFQRNFNEQDLIISHCLKIYINKNNKIDIHLEKFGDDIDIYRDGLMTCYVFNNKTIFVYEDVIYYLDNLEKIHPIEILEKLLFLNNLENIYSKLLKNRKLHQIKKINFDILNKFDKEYYNDIFNSLNFKQKLQILKFERNSYQYNYNLLSGLIEKHTEIQEIKKIIKRIKFLVTNDPNYDILYNNNNLYINYLNYLSVDNLLNKLKGEKITNNRAFEMINYLYSFCDLSYQQNIILINILNNKYNSHNDLIVLKNKIISKMITNNSNLDNQVYNELTKFDNLVEGLINLLISKNNDINK